MCFRAKRTHPPLCILLFLSWWLFSLSVWVDTFTVRVYLQRVTSLQFCCWNNGLHPREGFLKGVSASSSGSGSHSKGNNRNIANRSRNVILTALLPLSSAVAFSSLAGIAVFCIIQTSHNLYAPECGKDVGRERFQRIQRVKGFIWVYHLTHCTAALEVKRPTCVSMLAVYKIKTQLFQQTLQRVQL